MGGAEGVRAREQYTLVTGIRGGMFMHALPRVAAQGAPACGCQSADD